MYPSRRQALLQRIPFVAMVMTALFWVVWSIFAPVPKTGKIQLDPYHAWQLRFVLSWCIVPLVGSWIWSIVWLLSHPATYKRYAKEGLRFTLLFGLFGSFGIGVVFLCVVFGMLSGIVPKSMSFLPLLITGMLVGYYINVLVGSHVGLASGLVTGALFSPIFGIGYGLGFGLAIGLIVLLKACFSTAFWKRLVRWLIAADRNVTDNSAFS